MLIQRPREASPREELLRISIVLGSGAGDDLLQGDRELFRAERATYRTSLRSVTTRYQGSISRYLHSTGDARCGRGHHGS